MVSFSRERACCGKWTSLRPRLSNSNKESKAEGMKLKRNKDGMVPESKERRFYFVNKLAELTILNAVEAQNDIKTEKYNLDLVTNDGGAFLKSQMTLQKPV